MTEELKACRNCGGQCDPKGWMCGDGRQGPECEGCGITTPDVESWNRLMGETSPSQGGEAVEVVPRATGGMYVGFDIIRKPEPPMAVITRPVDPDAVAEAVRRELLERICQAADACRDNPMALFNAVEELRALLEVKQ